MVSQQKKVLKISSEILSLQARANETTTMELARSANTQTVTSQSSAISQLTEQVAQIKLENKQLLDHFDHLATQMEAFMTQSQPPSRGHARGHNKPPW